MGEPLTGKEDVAALIQSARELVNPIVMIGDFDDDYDEMERTYPQPSKHDANAAVDMLATTLEALQSRCERLEAAAARVLEWWPLDSEKRSLAGSLKGSAFADDIRALRAALTPAEGEQR